MKKFNISYHFVGVGETTIEANSEKEAENMWRGGEFDDKADENWGEDYEIDNIEEIE